MAIGPVIVPGVALSKRISAFAVVKPTRVAAWAVPVIRKRTASVATHVRHIVPVPPRVAIVGSILSTRTVANPYSIAPVAVRNEATSAARTVTPWAGLVA